MEKLETTMGAMTLDAKSSDAIQVDAAGFSTRLNVKVGQLAAKVNSAENAATLQEGVLALLKVETEGEEQLAVKAGKIAGHALETAAKMFTQAQSKTKYDEIRSSGARKIWIDAIEKEHNQLDERGVFEYMTYQEGVERGFITASKKPIPLRLLLNTKVNPDGSFQKVKARSVLSGDRMIKGLHYSVVFCASPTLAASKILQGMIVKKNSVEEYSICAGQRSDTTTRPLLRRILSTDWATRSIVDAPR